MKISHITKKNYSLPDIYSAFDKQLFAGTTDSTVVKRTYQTAFAKTAPVIDGLGNDDCWNLVEWTVRFYSVSTG